MKAVIPAAGSGTRMFPITTYLPKGMLPLGKKPVLAHIVEELKEASVDKIAIVTRSNQTAVFKYFMEDPKVNLIIDDSQSGPGGAILNAEEFVGEDDFLAVFADAPIKGKQRGAYLRELVEAKNNHKAEAAVAIYEILEAEISDRGVVDFKDQNISEKSPVRLTDIKEKPSADQEVKPWAAACRYVLSTSIFDALKNIEPDDNDELQLTPALQHLINDGKTVMGYPLPVRLTRHDTGHFEGYFEAFRDFTYKNPGKNKRDE